MLPRILQVTAQLLLALCLFVGQAHAGSTTLLGAGKPAAGGFTPSCTESSNFIARTSGLDNTHKTNYDTLICGLVTDGIFTKLDVLYVFATDTTTNALLNLKSSSFNGTVTGSLTFNANVGYTGTGATNYIDTGFNPTAASGNFTQNSGTIGAYIRTSRAVDQGYISIGTQANNFTFILPFGQFADLFQYAVNSVTPNTAANTNAQGQWIVSRTGATAIAAQKNGAAFDSGTNVSGAIDNANILVFASDLGGSAGGFSLDQQSAVLIGGGLTGTEMANLAGRLNTYMTAYGINVY